MSAILTLEGTAGIGYDPALLEDLHAIGFRISSLGWNESNPLTGSHKTGGGLTDQGREFVKEAQRLGILVDVSHISDEGFWDMMDVTNAPIIATHSNSRAVWNDSRNLTDEMFLAITESKKIVSGEGEDSQVSFEKHKIFLYKEDFGKFIDGLRQAIQYIENEGNGDLPLPEEGNTEEIKIDIDF